MFHRGLLLIVSLAVLGAASAFFLAPGAAPRGAKARAPVSAGALQSPPPPTRPGPSPPDLFRPGFDAERDRRPPPREGGRVIVHLEAMPESMNYLIENSAVTRRMQYEVHEYLVQRDWESWQQRGVLAERWDVEDALVLKGGRGGGDANVLYGRVEERGDAWLVTPVATKGRRLDAPREVAKADVESVERGTVYTFYLRPGVRWHDGQSFGADDVLFTWRCTKNPGVNCGDKRWQFDKIVSAEALDPLAVRFVFAKPYFLALVLFEGLTILPAHLYDLSDPDNPARKEGASAAEQASFVNENPHNRAWVGLGPYRVAEWATQYIELERFDGYFDRSEAGHVDAIRWRLFDNDDAAMRAALEGELDFFARVSAEHYFGATTEGEDFTARFYKGYFYTPNTSYTVWNTLRPKLADARVRRALAMCFDWDEFVRSFYKGLAARVTSEEPYASANYDHALEPLPFDLERSAELFAEAGWYDRDGDGLLDKDGEALEIELLLPAGNKVSETIGQLFQEHLARVGVRLSLATRDWATMSQRLHQRDFDAAALAWVMPLERDPEQLWHSRQVGQKTSNHASFADPEVDRWIESLQVELDGSKRAELFHRMQRKLYELQPYMWGVTVPRKFVVAKRVRNLQLFAIDPGFSIRRWWLDAP